MKRKHLEHRIRTCLSLASLSPCKRRTFGCVVVDPDTNVILSEGYNGNLRGLSELCGGATCVRRDLEPGARYEEGCVHAEQNAIYNAARIGTSLVGSWFIINGEPCKLCAKGIAQVGAEKVICIAGVFGFNEGVDILRSAGVEVVLVESDLSNINEALGSRFHKLPTVAMYQAHESPFTSPST